MKKRILNYLGLFLVSSISSELYCNKVVIPAAGLGTRLLPFTKTVPKEMIPLGSKPAIQIIIEEAMASDIQNVITIISRHKSALEHFFNPEKAVALSEANKDYFLADFHRMFSSLHFSYIYQDNPLGLGHAVMLAQETVGNEYFGIMLPDDIIFSDRPTLRTLYDIAQKEQASVIAIQEVPIQDVNRYGIISIKKDMGNGLYEIADLVEKPSQDKAPSRLAIIGRYVLSPKIFESLNELYAHHTSGELQLTDAIAHMLHHKQERVLAYKINGERHDIGIPLGWIKSVVAYALKAPEYKNDVFNYIQQILKQSDY